MARSFRLQSTSTKNPMGADVSAESLPTLAPAGLVNTDVVPGVDHRKVTPTDMIQVNTAIIEERLRRLICAGEAWASIGNAPTP